MQRRTYALWLLALALKLAGASWDVSWHFRTVRESISPPHILNGAGEILFVVLFWHAWRHRQPHQLMPLRIMIVGMATWALAVPLDEAWHRIYGLDLTTWSPSHLMLFYGTAIAVAGLALLFASDIGWRPGKAFDLRAQPWLARAILALFILFAAEAVLFPLTYSEHTTIAVDNAANHPERLDPALLEMALTVPDPYFHGVAPWVYPVYAVAAVAFVAVLARRFLPGPGWTLAILGGYVLYRGATDMILGAGEWPRSVVPLQYVPMALAWEAAWLAPARPRVRTAAGVAASTLAAYATWAWMPTVALAIPIGMASWPGALLAGAAAAALATYMADLAHDPAAGTGPVATAVRRRVAVWEASARALVARRR